MGVGPDEFRRAARRFATGIAIVTTRSGVTGGGPLGEGDEYTDHAMTVNSFTSVSLEPPLALFCAEKVARFHDAVLQAGTWGVSILGVDGEEASRYAATRGRPLEGQLNGRPHYSGPVTGVPLFEDAIACLECRTTAAHDAGDHTIIVGEVVGTRVHIDAEGPLLYYEGGYRRLRG